MYTRQDPQGDNGLYNPGRGFRLETAVDVLHEKDTPTKELNELSAKYVEMCIRDSISISWAASGMLVRQRKKNSRK